MINDPIKITVAMKITTMVMMMMMMDESVVITDENRQPQHDHYLDDTDDA